MKSHKELDFKLKSFKLVYDVNEHFHDEFVWRLNKVAKRGVCELTVLNMVDVDEALVRMPLSLYSCATLVNLTLYCVVFDHPESKSVSLPCVKSMYLEGVKFDGDSVLETLISSCPVLEDLTVITHPNDYFEVVRVRSQSLKSFRLESQLLECDDPDVGFECDDDPDVEIDAPYLEYMSIRDYQLRSFIIHSIGPSAEVNIDVVFDFEYDDPVEITKIHNFLIAISTFHKVTISARTLAVIHSYSEVEPLPPFSNLSRLDASLVESSWEVLPAFLGCCMNLHSLVVELDHLPEIEEIRLSPVPQCVLSSINSLQLKTPSTPSKMKLATYFWKNCTALKKMHLSGR
ncbi:Leucine-rich repeat 2 [Arabidopsis thaliana x Arabidopsis arenosa]|uniref:Leucine-rich repeat 2 n=1 Tax=Arabidopsis thaliana x Arabidopsis arenosa TaxID=1240361 RepID=A0A8T2BF96_9BRAS|nr:Leucine-rich repeat 2 [Arabidopsis thaliana x Arabidopsis arenosa]